MSDKQSPMAGYTRREMAEVIGYAVMHELEEQGMEIVWKPKNDIDHFSR